MKSLKIIIASCILLISSCQTTIPRFDEIPKGEHCIILSSGGFCINELTSNEYPKSFLEMRGYEAVSLGYKEDLEDFIYDILKENYALRQACGRKCKE